jgi:hypothetical protein
VALSQAQRNLRIRIAAYILGGLAAGTLIATPVLINVLLAISDPVFRVPEDSSYLTFRVTQMNPGSGDWWLSGEDRRNYYEYAGSYADLESTDLHYYAYPKSKVADCKGFLPKELSTWCPEFKFSRRK